jgi:hypothetical protein
MRRTCEVTTNRGDTPTGDKEIDKDKNEPHSIVYRIDKEVARPLSLGTSTLFRISKFKYCRKKFLAACVT